MERLPPTILVIFGITGDLSRRYLLPALGEICEATQLGKDFRVLGISRRRVSLDEVFSHRQANLKPFSSILTMDLARAADYQKLKSQLTKLSQDFASKPQIIFYLSVPAAAVETIIGRLGTSGLNRPHMKLLLEKPFGYDYASAKKLVEQTAKCFSEDQVYRIDHYLAKEMAQNITVFLGSNALFRDVWNNKFIADIEIIVSEKIGIEGRVGFYESTGALRDVVQSHLLQLAALVLMEPCSDIFDFEEIPRRRLAALKALKAPPKDKLASEVLRAQYAGYAAEVKNPGSRVETFVALSLYSSDPAWRAVPLHLTTGKKLDQKLTEIRVNFKKTSSTAANALVFRIQPNEGIELDLWVKEPGYDRKLQKLKWSFNYDQHFGRLPDAYEMVIVDAMRGNHSLFASAAEVLASWQVLAPILEHWDVDSSKLKTYRVGSTTGQVLKSV